MPKREMKKPEKKECTDIAAHLTLAQIRENMSYNQACDDWEKYLEVVKGWYAQAMKDTVASLPTEEEIAKIIEENTVGKPIVQVDRVAKAIHQRIHQ